ncbi:hypothetical protein, partial [Vibrio lentus]|uniref:hypothetical protein n=1 Tax=Vibrio lentus TaxID=136468 RepID=UPI0013000AAF
SFLSGFLPINSLPEIIKDSMTLKLSSGDWLDGESSVRTSIFAIYPTASAVTAFLLFFFSTLEDRLFSKKFLFLLILSSILIVSTHSRMPLAMLFLYLVLVVFFESKFVTKTIFITLFILMIISASPFLVDFMNFVVLSRESSSSLRKGGIE